MWDIDSTRALLRDMSAANDPEKLLRLILAHARRSIHLDRAVVLSRKGLQFPYYRVSRMVSCGERAFDDETHEKGVVRAGGVLATLLYAGRFHCTSALSTDSSEPAWDLLAGSRSMLAFPVFDQGDPIEMVVMLGPSLHSFQTTEICGMAIMGALLQRADRAWSLSQQLEETCRALDAELAGAADVQRWLLPAAAPSRSDIDVASSYRPAHRAGGDYYDAGNLHDGRFGVMIADVSGHGAAAALLMAILRTVVHDEVDRSSVPGPAALLDYADDRLCTIGLPDRGSFVTAFSATMHTRTGELTYSCAGHPPPRLLRSRSRTIDPLDGASTLPLGAIHESPRHTEETIKLSPRDLIVCYSDGITEARSPAGEFFGVARLDRALQELPARATSQQVVDAIERAVSCFTNGSAPADDQTLFAMRWQPN